MPMIPKIENRAYHYQGDNVCAVSATLNIYGPDGVTIVASTGLNASYSIAQPDYVADITRQINQQVGDYLAKLAQLDAMRNQDGETITVAQGSPVKVWVPLAAPSEGALIARLL